MTGTSAALLLLLAAAHLAHAGPLFRSPCELLPVGESHPVQALQRSFTALAGCASRATAMLPQEVHIVNMRRNDVTATPPPGPTEVMVRLHLKPLQSLLTHSKPLVFILNSPQPVVWDVHTEKLALGVKHTFHVSPGSQVQFPAGNFSLASQVVQGIPPHGSNLPHGNEHLLSWALRKYSAITSFLELRMTRDIYVSVGEDRVFPESCRIDNKFLSLNYLGAYVEPQPSRGCVLSSSQGPEVHIIELQAPNSSSAFQVDVIVEMQPIPGHAPLNRDLVLILKCSKSVNWVIKSRDVHGKLEVLSSDTIALSPATERQMEVTKRPKQALPSGSQALIQWAEQRGYRPVSFTGTAVANLFNLRLREPVLRPTDSVFPPELAIFRDMGAAGGPDHGGPTFPFLPPPFHPAWDDGEPQEGQGVLSAGLQVRCEETRMVVSLDKESMQASGFANANLTLQDPECKATVNATHFTLETPLSGCQTTVYPMLGASSVAYINSIVISAGGEGRDGSGRVLQDYEDQEDPRFSRDPRDPRDMDKSFLEPSIWFNCTYPGKREVPAPGIPLGPAGGPEDEEDEEMELFMNVYDTLLFHSTHPQPTPTFSPGQQVFVEIVPSRVDQDLGFMIRSCFVTPSRSPREPSEYGLVENLCPTDESVRFYPVMADRQRFSFRLGPQANASLLFLHCEMSLCSKTRPGNPRLPQCIPASQGCDAVDLSLIMSMMLNSRTSTQELQLTSDQRDPHNPTDGPIDGSSETLYVLDPPTVVCIAFAAFVIGAMLTGALWFIYSNTGGGEAAPQQEVQKPQPISENSSAAHSIGSTQSTPCSSSSTA